MQHVFWWKRLSLTVSTANLVQMGSDRQWLTLFLVTVKFLRIMEWDSKIATHCTKNLGENGVLSANFFYGAFLLPMNQCCVAKFWENWFKHTKERRSGRTETCINYNRCFSVHTEGDQNDEKEALSQINSFQYKVMVVKAVCSDAQYFKYKYLMYIFQIESCILYLKCDLL